MTRSAPSSVPFFTTRVGVSLVDYTPPGRSDDKNLEKARSHFKDRYGVGTTSVAKFEAQKRHRLAKPAQHNGDGTLQQEVDDLRARLEQAESEVASLRAEREIARKASREKDSEIACLQAELKSLNLAFESRSNEIEGQDIEVKNLRAKMDKAFEDHDRNLKQRGSAADAGKERHRALLLKMVGSWTANAEFEMVRVCWSAWYKLQQGLRRDVYKREIARARKAARMAEKPAHIKALERWTANRKEFVAIMYFKEWLAWLREEKEIAKIADEKLSEEERSKAHVREKLEQQQRAEKRLHCVRATIARLASGQANVLLRSLWSSWIEFAEKERQEKALQEASLEHASRNRQRALQAFMMMTSMKDAESIQSYLHGVFATWRHYVVTCKRERDALLEQRRLSEVHTRQIEQMIRREAIKLWGIQLLTLWISWREYVQISVKERIINMEQQHKEDLHEQHVKRVALCMDMFGMGEARALQIVWSAWCEIMREAYLNKERERERREIARIQEQASEAQRKLRIDYFMRLAFARQQENDPILLQTVCSHWHEILQAKKREDAAEKGIYLKALEKTDSTTIQKFQEIRGNNMDLKMGTMLGLWDDRCLLQRCWFSWKAIYIHERNQISHGKCNQCCPRRRWSWRSCCHLWLILVSAIVIALMLSVAIALVLAKVRVISADELPFGQEWQSLDLAIVAPDMALALYLGLVVIATAQFGMISVRACRKAKRHKSRRCRCHLWLTLVSAIVIALMLSVAVALVLAKASVISADELPFEQEWKSLDLGVEADVALALYLGLVVIATAVFSLISVRACRKAKRHKRYHES